MSVHLRGDLLRRMIVNGEAAITPPLSEEATEQLRLRYQLASYAALHYCQAGFTVVYQDIIIGPELNDVLAWLGNEYPVYLIVLCPSPEVVAAREAGRAKTGYRDGWTPAWHHPAHRATWHRVR
jgi:hypothetical protein